MDTVEHAEMAEKQLDAIIQRRSRKGDVDPDEIEPGYVERVRRFNARREQEMRAGWCEHHQDQPARLRVVLEALRASYEGEAAKVLDV